MADGPTIGLALGILGAQIESASHTKRHNIHLLSLNRISNHMHWFQVIIYYIYIYMYLTTYCLKKRNRRMENFLNAYRLT